MKEKCLNCTKLKLCEECIKNIIIKYKLYVEEEDLDAESIHTESDRSMSSDSSDLSGFIVDDKSECKEKKTKQRKRIRFIKKAPTNK